MRIFVSYQTLDDPVAKAVSDGIKAHRPGATLFFARETLSAGAYWLPRLAEEIKNSHAVLLLIGKRIGKWQELEYLEAVRLARDTGKPLIVPVVMGDYAPGLPFFDQYHGLFCRDPASQESLSAILKALDGAPADEAAPLWAQFNPYRGLAAFTSADSAFFFGREALTAEILTHMQNDENKVLVLFGNSGVGKSSLAQAGVIAALKQQSWPAGDAWPKELAESRNWLPLTIRPEDKPLRSLALSFMGLIYERSSDQDADAEGWVRRFREGTGFGDFMSVLETRLAQKLDSDAPQDFLLYIDQGEELYVSAEREGQSDATAKGDAEAFSRLIAEAARRSNCRVLFSLRSDYYPNLQDDETLFAASLRVDVPPMRVDALREVIERPAAALGVNFEPAQVPSYLAGATAREAGALPLLAYLLSDMWREMQRREDGRMRFGELPGIFDVSAALRDRAERYLTKHKSRERDIKRLFTLRLAQVPRLGDVIKRRARREECSDAEWAIAEELATEKWRLVTLEGGSSGEVTAEVAHEQILHKWPALEGWLKELRDFLLWKAELEAAREAYDDTPEKEKAGALLSGRRLLIARNWLASYSDDLAKKDRTFIQASIKADRKIVLRTRVVAGSLLGLTIAVAGALIKAQQANITAQKAELDRSVALSNYSVAVNSLDVLVRDIAEVIQDAQGIPNDTIERILTNEQVLAESLKTESQGDKRLEATRAAILYLLGETFPKNGQKNEAIKASNLSLQIRRQLAKDNPESEEAAAALSQSLVLAGDLERDNGDLNHARIYFNESEDIGTRLNAKYPKNVNFAINLSQTLTRLGDLDLHKDYQESKSNYSHAFENYSHAFETIKVVLRDTNGEPSKRLQREVTWNYNKRGDVEFALQHYAEAMVSFEAAFCLRKHLLIGEPGNTKLKHDISWSYDKLAGVKLKLSDIKGALEAQFASLSIRRELVQSQKEQLIWRRDMAAALHQIGEIKAKMGDFPTALAFFKEAAKERLEVKEKAPNDKAQAEYRTSVTRAEETRATVLGTQPEWAGPPDSEVVKDEERRAAARAEAGDHDGDACWKQTIKLK